MVVVGIDLGTTFSSIATMDGTGKPYIICNEYSERTTPSVIYFNGTTAIVGRDACSEESIEPQRAIRLVKRHMGDSDFLFQVDAKEYSATQLSSFILRYLLSQAESHLEKKVTAAVITVPAYFLDEERIATKNSGKQAGVDVLRLVNEPTAAAVAYGYFHPQNFRRVLTFDLGGGTFDLTLLEMKDKGEFNVMASIGESHLGGADWDDVLINLIAEEFTLRCEVDLREIPEYLPLLRTKAIYAKHSLSQRQQISLEISHAKNKEKIDLTRQQFAQASLPLLEQTEIKLQQLLQQTKTKDEDIDAVLLVGGATRMPMVQQMLERLLHKKPLAGIAPEEAVALGAAIMAHLETQKNGGLVVFPQASGLKVQDITAHSLGMVVLNKSGERCNSIIIPQFTPIPAKSIKDNFATSFDAQTQLELQVVQGEDRNPQNCEVLASYRFSGIPPRPRGQSAISISFCYNKDGIIEVDAVDVASGTKLAKENIKEIEEESSWPSYIFLLLDCSRSMTRVLTKAKKAAIDFISKTCGTRVRKSSATGLSVLEKTRVTGLSVPRESLATGLTLATRQPQYNNTHCGLITFGGSEGYHLEHDLSDDPGSLIQTIEAISTAQGETYMASALGLAGKELTSQPPGHKTIVLVTDGCPKDVEMTMRNAQRAKEHKIRIITIGLGKHAHRAFLKKISSGSSYYSEHYTGITKIFANLLMEI